MLSSYMLEDSPSVPFQGLVCEETGYSFELEKGGSPSLIKDEHFIRCKSENPMSSGPASGDRSSTGRPVT